MARVARSRPPPVKAEVKADDIPPPHHGSPNFDAAYIDRDGRPCARCRACGEVVWTDIPGSIRKHSAKHRRAARRNPSNYTASCREVVALRVQVVNLKRKRENVRMELERAKRALENEKRKSAEMKEQLTCTLCVDRPCMTAFMCGHRTCDLCAGRLLHCHICRGDATTKIRLF